MGMGVMALTGVVAVTRGCCGVWPVMVGMVWRGVRPIVVVVMAVMLGCSGWVVLVVAVMGMVRVGRVAVVV